MSQGQQRGHETLANGVGDPLAARGPGISLRSMPPCCEQTAGEQEVQRGPGGLRPPGEHVLRDPGQRRPLDDSEHRLQRLAGCSVEWSGVAVS